MMVSGDEDHQAQQQNQNSEHDEERNEQILIARFCFALHAVLTCKSMNTLRL